MCKTLGIITSKDIWEYVKEERNCQFFEPKLINDEIKKGKTVGRTVIDILKESSLLAPSIKNYLEVGKNSHMQSRGLAMIMLSDDNLPLFEHDSNYKSYEYNNHVFADLLVPINDIISNPIVFWLGKSHPAGANYLFKEEPFPHHVLQLGKPYKLEDVLFCLSRALKFEKVRLNQNSLNLIAPLIQKESGEVDPLIKEVFEE